MEVVRLFNTLFGTGMSKSTMLTWAGLLQHEPRASLEVEVRAVNELARNWTGSKPPYYGHLADEIERQVHQWKLDHPDPEVQVEKIDEASRIEIARQLDELKRRFNERGFADPA